MDERIYRSSLVPGRSPRESTAFRYWYRCGSFPVGEVRLLLGRACLGAVPVTQAYLVLVREGGIVGR